MVYGDPDAIAVRLQIQSVGPIRDQSMIIVPHGDHHEVLYRTRDLSRLDAVRHALVRAYEYGCAQQDWPANGEQLFSMIQFGDTDWMVRTNTDALYSSSSKADAEMVLQACRRMASISRP